MLKYISAVLILTFSNTVRRYFRAFTVGGGIRTIRDIKALRVGADKVAINTYAIKDLIFYFGSQCIVLYRSEKLEKINGRPIPTVAEKTGDVVTAKSRWVGCGEILITSIDRDVLKGFEAELVTAISSWRRFL